MTMNNTLCLGLFLLARPSRQFAVHSSASGPHSSLLHEALQSSLGCSFKFHFPLLVVPCPRWPPLGGVPRTLQTAHEGIMHA